MPVLTTACPAGHVHPEAVGVYPDRHVHPVAVLVDPAGHVQALFTQVCPAGHAHPPEGVLTYPPVQAACLLLHVPSLHSEPVGQSHRYPSALIVDPCGQVQPPSTSVYGEGHDVGAVPAPRQTKSVVYESTWAFWNGQYYLRMQAPK